MFAGFPPEGIKFLKQLEKNNDRDWFQARKETYETKLRAPMAELVEAINAELRKFAPEHITDPKKAIYRIYRDTRFSNDKTPYKTHAAAIFPRRGLDKHSSAGYYFHVSPKSVMIAAGAYMPGPDQLYPIRTWLTENHAAFLKTAAKAEKICGKLQGESMTRSPKGFDPAHPAADLVKQKSWLFWQELDAELACSPKLLPELVKRFKAAAPVIAAINTPLLKAARPTIE